MRSGMERFGTTHRVQGLGVCMAPAPRIRAAVGGAAAGAPPSAAGGPCQLPPARLGCEQRSSLMECAGTGRRARAARVTAVGSPAPGRPTAPGCDPRRCAQDRVQRARRHDTTTLPRAVEAGAPGPKRPAEPWPPWPAAAVQPGAALGSAAAGRRATQTRWPRAAPADLGAASRGVRPMPRTTRLPTGRSARLGLAGGRAARPLGRGNPFVGVCAVLRSASSPSLPIRPSKGIVQATDTYFAWSRPQRQPPDT